MQDRKSSINVALKVDQKYDLFIGKYRRDITSGVAGTLAVPGKG